MTWNFMKKVPPSWKAARKHARANKVLRGMQRPDLKDTDSYCLCCQKPFPDKQNEFSICTPNLELHETGEGFPIYF